MERVQQKSKKRSIFNLSTCQGAKIARETEALQIRKSSRSKLAMEKRGGFSSATSSGCTETPADPLDPLGSNPKGAMGGEQVFMGSGQLRCDLTRTPPECIDTYNSMQILLGEHVRLCSELAKIKEHEGAIPDYIVLGEQGGVSFKVSREMVVLELLPVYVDYLINDKLQPPPTMTEKLEALVCIRMMFPQNAKEVSPWPVRALIESGILPTIVDLASGPDTPMEWRQEAFTILIRLSWPVRHGTQQWDATAAIVSVGAMDVYTKTLEWIKIENEEAVDFKQFALNNANLCIDSLANIALDARSDICKECITRGIPAQILGAFLYLWGVLGNTEAKKYLDAVRDSMWFFFLALFKQGMAPDKDTLDSIVVFIHQHALPQFYSLPSFLEMQDLMALLEYISASSDEMADLFFCLDLWKDVVSITVHAFQAKEKLVPIIRFGLRILHQLILASVRAKNTNTGNGKENIKLLWDVGLMQILLEGLTVKDDQVRITCCEIAAKLALEDEYNMEILTHATFVQNVLLLPLVTYDVRHACLMILHSLMSHRGDILVALKLINEHPTLIEILVQSIDPSANVATKNSVLVLEIILHVMDKTSLSEEQWINTFSVQIADKLRKCGILGKLSDIVHNIVDNELSSYACQLVDTYFGDSEDMDASSDYASGPFTLSTQVTHHSNANANLNINIPLDPLYPVFNFN